MAKRPALTPEPGHQLARDYWQVSRHAAMMGYPTRDLCSLCDQTESFDQHIPLSAQIPRYVKHVAQEDSLGSIFMLTPSCGHSPLRKVRTDRRKPAPQVGDAFDCWDCEELWQAQNRPPLPEELLMRIESMVPHCPECGGSIEKIPFIVIVQHEIAFETDGRNGAISGTSEHSDTLDERPDWTDSETQLPDDWTQGTICVECSDHHSWETSNLAWRYKDGDHQWRIV